MSKGVENYSRGTAKEDFHPLTLIELLLWRARRQPFQKAYTFLKDDDVEASSLTYEELDRQARAVAALLQELGLRGERVLLLYPPGLEYIAGFFGCLYAGMIAVPAYPPNPSKFSRSLPRLLGVVADAQATIALTTEAILSRVKPMLDQSPLLQSLNWASGDNPESGIEDEWMQSPITGDALALLQYTSGSTGTPKGVMLSHSNLLHNANLVYHSVEHTPNDCYVSWLPIFHDMGFMAGILQPLYAGIPAVSMSPMTFLQRPLLWLKAITRYRATTSGGPNFAYDLCVRKIAPEQREELDLCSWSVAFNGAEPIRHETLDRFTEAFTPCGFRRQAFYPCYGLAEATLIVSGGAKTAPPVVSTFQARELSTHLALETNEEHDSRRVLVGCGKTLLEQKIAIVNPESLTECPPNEVGEIWVSGSSIAQGYWNSEEETARTFHAHLADTCEGPFLRTGDLGFLSGGELYVTGRLKDLIIIRGLNHYPQDIELSVERSHPALRSGCGAAFSVEIEGDERLVVVQEVENRQRPDIKAVIGNIREAIAQQHEIHPFAVVLIKPGGIPKTTSGKIQRRATRRAFLAGDLEALGEWRDQGANSTHGSFEERMASIEGVEAVASLLASEIAFRLGCDPASVDLNQPIARYGIDSLWAIELIHLVETRFGAILPVSRLLQSSSIAELSFSIAERRSKIPAAPDLLPAPREEILSAHPLSHGQKALWFLRQLAPESPAYNISSAARIQHALDPAALRRAFQIIVERHPSLRTRFTSSDGQPVQEIRASGEISFSEIDASAMSPEELSERLVVEANRPFDLENGPLLRVNLYRRATDEYVLLLSVHHIAVDFWSLAIIMKELGILYTAERIGVRITLPSPALQYTDYARWQAELLASPEGERLRNYWLVELTGALSALDLPTDRPRPKIQTYRGDSFSFKLDSNLTSRLKGIGQASGATLYMTLLAAFQVLLYRYTNQERFVVGSPTAGRSRADLAGLIGYVVNLLVLRADLSGNPAFNEYLERVREVVLGAFDHQEYPFPLLVEQLQPERELSRSPIVQVVFAWQKAQALAGESSASFALGENGARLALGELQLESLALAERVAQFDLTMMMSEENDSLAGSLQFNPDLFDQETIEGCARRFQTLIESITRNPQCRVSDLELISESELEQFLVEWNDTAYEQAGGLFVHRLFELQAGRTPDAVAVADVNHQVTYRELNLRANQIAHYLRRRGVGVESPVSVCLMRSAQMITGLLGILKAGGAYLPLDPAYPRERLSFMVRDAAAPALLTEQGLAGDFAEFEPHVVRLDSDWKEIAQESETNPNVEATSEHLAYVIYTSGSTGEPKGVEVQHAGLSNLVTWHQRTYGLTPGDRATQLAGSAFDAAVWELWPYLTAGASIHIPDNETRASASKLIEWLAAEAITICFLPTPLAEMLIEGPLPPDLGLRAILTGGDALHHGPRRALPFALVNHYGPTENTVVATRAEVSPVTDAAPPIGRPIDNTQVYLVDVNLHPVPIRAPGELHIGGVGLARGYCRRPELSAEKFIPNPFCREPGGRLYRTGDLARYLPNGQIEFLGRIDHQVKVRGFRVELGEVEAALRQHEDIREAIVVARENLPGTKRLVAYVLPVKGPVEGQSTLAFSLQRFLRRKLPEYMVPAAFVLLQELPLTPNGKIDYRALPTPKDHMALESNSERERTPAEDLLSGIYAEALGSNQVGLHDNFFALGGHSLTATQVISRVKQTFQVELSLQSLFAFPTVAGLAEQVERAWRDGRQSPTTPLLPVPRDDELPLSFAQQRLWFLDQLDPGNSLYNIPAAIRLRGPLDQSALGRSLTEILRRHESLRASFPSSQGQPVQRISAPRPFALTSFDLRELSGEEKPALCAAAIAEESELPFDLSLGPLVRARLLRLEEEEHLLTLTMHHIVADGWSMVILVKELSALYDAFKRGDASPLTEPVIQYADYTVWQRKWLVNEILASQVEYWKRQLKDAPVTLELPTDRLRPSVQSFSGAAESRVLPSELCEDLKALSRREGVTPFMTLLGAFQVQLSRYSGQPDIAVGTPIAGRNRVEVEGLIGLFVNTLVLRTDLGGEPTFKELLSRVREVALSGHANQDAPFEKLVEVLQVERDRSRSPLFEVMFAYQNAIEYPQKLGDLEMRRVKGETRRAKFDLTLRLEQSVEGLVASMEYKTGLFEAETIRRLLGHYEQLLSGVVRESEISVRQLPLLCEQERLQLLIDFNDTSRDYPAEVCLHLLFERQVKRSPEAVAVVYEEQSLSYRDLNARANRLAHYLRRLGVGPEARVGICMERSLEMVVGLLGILKAGGAYVPLDPDYPKARLLSMLEDSSPRVVVTKLELAPQLPEHETPVVCLDGDWEQIGRLSAENPMSGVGGVNVAYVIYTSGSTGRPKGAMNTHRGIGNRLRWMQQAYGLTEGDAVLQKTPFSFDVSVWEFFWPLMYGGRLVVARPGGHRETRYLVKVIQEQQVSLIHFVPSMLAAFMADGSARESGMLRKVFSSGEALGAELVKEWYRQRADTELHNLYGPTEAAVDVTSWKCERGEAAEMAPIGRPIANTKAYVLDWQQQPAPVGVYGELYLGGAGLARGYLNRPDLTAERFVPDPFGEVGGERLYRTGDETRWRADGNLEFRGRLDQQVKLRGYRIELGEIETVLNEHRSVRQSVVVAREDERGEKQLIGYVVEEGVATPAELKRHVRERLPEYMVPQAIVVLEEMPVTANGKIDRKRLSSLPAPAPLNDAGKQSEHEDTRARTPVEEMLVRVFEEVLKIDRVGIHDNFFEIGGHSLLATQVISRIRSIFGLEVGVGIIFEAPTVERLSRRIEKAINSEEKDEAPSLVKVSREGRLPLSFAQQRLWFIHQLVADKTTYNMPTAVRLEGQLETKALERVINEIVRRHEALRTRIEVEAGEPAQVIDQWESRRLERIDLTGMVREEREEEARRIAREEAGTEFDLSREQLLRVKVLKLEEEEHVLLFTMSHIASDGWSNGILIKELGALYRAYCAGEPSPLVELPIQYADFAVWQREWLKGEMLERELKYWRGQLTDVEPLELPLDFPRQALAAYRGASLNFEYPEELTGGLLGLSRREGTTLFMTLLAAFQTLLMRYSGQEKIAVGSPIANRTRAEIEGLIGFFVNTLVLRTEVEGGLSFQELLRKVRGICLGAYAHQNLPFEYLVEQLQPERDLSRQPLFQVMLALQNAPTQELELPGLRVRSLEIPIETSKFDLLLTVTEVANRLACNINYDSDLFEATTIDRFTGHLGMVLRAVVAKPDGLISEIEYLTAEERRQILEEWNDTRREYAVEHCMHELFERQMERIPEAVALVFEGGCLSYRELDRRANQLAHYLIEKGVGAEAVIGLCMERSPEMLVGLLGILKAGGAYLPLDSAYPKPKLAFMLEDAQVAALLTGGRLRAGLPESQSCVVSLESEWEEIARYDNTNPKTEVRPGNLAYLIYTSGSTGNPKGVAIEHQNAVAFIEWAKEEFEECDLRGVLASTSICFDLSVFEIFVTLSCGGKVILADNALELMTLKARHEVSLINTVPSAMAELVRMRAIPDAVRVVNLAGEALHQGLVEEIYEHSKVELVKNLYGPTEDTTYSTYELVERGADVTIGRPVDGSQVYVLDERMQPVSVGVTGEIYLAGAGLARGYMNRPELTAERFVADPFRKSVGGRLYKTGDLAKYRTDGRIEYLGRTDQQVKFRGYRIELGEIEHALMQHPAVSQSVVLLRQDHPSDKRLVAYVAPDRKYEGLDGSLSDEELSARLVVGPLRGEEAIAGVDWNRYANDPLRREPSAALAAELRSYIKQKLPEYMRPSVYVVMDEMPRTPNGKVDRRAFPDPEVKRSEEREDDIAPRNPVEEIVAGIFEEVLKVDRVGRDDGFFEIGGHSLLATQVVSRISEVFEVEIGVRDIFERPTVAGLAANLEEARKDGERPEAPSLTGIERGSRRGVRLPLSYAQQRLWLIDQLEPGNVAYNIAGALRLEGRLELEALEYAIDEVIRRHEALRTRIEVEAGEPAQVIDQWEPRRLELVDLTGLAREEREEAARGMAREEAGTGFDLSRGPLLRVKILKLEEDEHVLLYTMHHIVSDGWSMGILIKEVGALYQAWGAGMEPALEELPIQYVDYAVWQRGYLGRGVLEREVGYWKERLKGAAVIELPADHARPAMPSYRGGSERIELRGGLSEELRRLGRREGATLFMALMAAFKVLLMRYSGEEDVSVGTAIANRTRKGVESLIGFFVNTLVMRTDLSGNPSFRELVRREREVALGAYERQETPFEKLVEEINPQRELSRSPLFQVMMALQNTAQELQIEDLKISGIGGETGTAKFDLTLSLIEGGGGIWGSLEYSRDLYEAETIRRMVSHFERVVGEVVRDADQRIREIELLSAAEREQVVMKWNETGVEYLRDRSIPGLFEEQVEEWPERVAVVYEGHELTYRELNRRANQLAHHLRRLGVGPDARVGVCVERSVEMVVALLGALKAGGAYVPLDPAYPSERLAYMLEDGAPAVLLTHDAALAATAWRSPELPIVNLESDAWQWVGQSERNPGRAGMDARNLAYVIYTSGSTGTPKGVMNEHRAVVNRLMGMQRDYGLGECDVALQKTPFSFDVSVWEFFWPLLTGARLAVAQPGGHKNPSYLARTIQRQNVTTCHFVPSMLQFFLENGEASECRSLARVICSGEALSAALAQRFSERLPDTELYNLYGPTEAAIDVTAWNCRQGAVGIGVPIGRPVANTRIYVLDDRRQPAPIGVAGELHIGGAQVGRGYYNRPELTAERFLPDPFGREAGARVYRTGDLGRWLPEGQLEFRGRNDFQVKIRGFRIELGEIETRLINHPEVREAVVQVRENGEGGKRLVAYYTGEEIGAEALRSHLRSTLPEYMTPSAYVRLERLPLTPSGKLDRRELPAPEEADYLRRSYEPPVGETEIKLAGIWAELLKVERVGRHDNFFELGGHSLLAVQSLSRLRQALGAEAPLAALFSQPVLVDFALTVSRASQNKLPPITSVDRHQPLELSFAQQRLWFLAQFDGASEAYHIGGGQRLRGDLDREALRRALDRIVARHEALRTTFRQIEGRPVQVIGPAETRFLLAEDDLRYEADPQAALRQLAEKEVRQPFDLESGPLIRGRLAWLGDDERALLVTMHHIVSDGWSISILINELSRLYKSYRSGEEDSLPILPVQYADYAAWQRRWLSGQVWEEQAGYWKQALAGAPALLELPTDRPRPVQQDYAGQLVEIELEEGLTRELRALSRRHGATLYMTLLAGWAALLSRLSGQEEVVIGSPVANRMRAEIEPLIGFFVNTLALRIDISGSPTVSELLERVKERALEAQRHQDIPFEQVVAIMQPHRSLAYAPVFQTTFGWQNALEDEIDLPGLTLTPLAIPHVTAVFDLSLSLQEAGERIAGCLEYATALFDQATVCRFLGYWRTLLKAMVAGDMQVMARLPLLEEAEQHQALAEWNRTETDYPSDRCVHELFEAQVEKSPDAIALVQAEKSLTYEELNARANRLARHLCTLGVEHESRVVILLERSIDLVIAELAILKCGAAYVPIDPIFPAERQVLIAADCEARVAVTTRRWVLPEALDLLRTDIDGLSRVEAVDGNLNLRFDSGMTAYVIYTSGSTGRPKGVMTPHRAIGRLVLNCGYADFNASDRVAFAANPAFDAATMEVWAPLLNGGRIVVMDRESLLDSRSFAQLLEQCGVTTLFLTTAIFNQYSKTMPEALARLRLLLCGGEKSEPSSFTRVLEQSGPKHLIHCYGPTETTTFALTREVTEVPEDAKSIPLGRPISNTNIYILSADHEPAPIGVTGELYIGGAGVAQGYLNHPELTAERFLPDLFGRELGSRIYKTGDLGRWLPEGEIEFLGRNDFQIKIRGFRIEPGEIEAKLASHPEVREAVVLARDEGETGKRLVAYYTGEEIGAEALRAYLLSSLPEYMAPVAYIHLERLPLTPNGKLDRRALPAPDDQAHVLRGYEPPAGETETRLARIWGDLLKLERVGRHDNFFELGGHSLLAVQVIFLLRERLKVDIPLRTLFDLPTIAGLSEEIEKAGNKTMPTIKMLAREQYRLKLPMR